MQLVIVESPTKARTISRFLPRGFKVDSSYGHIRDLPSYELGVDVENNFEPHYVISRKARPVVKKLKEEAAEATHVILATDEDREGEAIAWHIQQALELDGKKGGPKPMDRIVFHEITKKAILDAIEHPRGVDQHLVDAQQARRILDRLVGYKLSPFLWRKVMSGLSAGRVQSVALRLIVERENEIRAFRPQTFWTIEAMLQKQNCTSQTAECIPFGATLESIDEKAIEKPGMLDKTEAVAVTDDLKKAAFSIASLEKRKRKRSPNPPFTTSTLQQDAFGRLGFSAKKTMTIAQQLYETGFITYMRTDSFAIAPEALLAASEYLKTTFGPDYAIPGGRRFKTASKLAQEAHEAIRPTNPAGTPDALNSKFKDSAQARLYELIWRRFMASQMPEALFDETRIAIHARGAKSYGLKGTGSLIRFDGFLKIYPYKTTDVILPELSDGETLALSGVESKERQTKGPARYSDASLVKVLEESGIGRPSTYAPTISTLEERGYVTRDDDKRFAPTEIGEKVIALLVEHFADVIDVDFTRAMEEKLDSIASGKKEWRPILQEFYEPFAKNLKEKYETVAKEDLTEPLDRACPTCGKSLIVRHGRFGRFIACSGFPECKYTEALPPVSLNIPCPLCNEGTIVERHTKTKRLFYGCSRWPQCKFATWRKPTGKLCIECASPLIETPTGEKCSNKSCSFRGKKGKSKKNE
ncbi:MAG: type I DNA topoisomerase [Candidatus Niyogibacteria bacterium]|nr:type I DNA topoisomerase [Candidatus Niyogibacteria bacterium]